MMFHENYYKTRLKIDVMQIKFIFLFLQTVCRSLERSVQSLTRDSIGRPGDSSPRSVLAAGVCEGGTGGGA